VTLPVPRSRKWVIGPGPLHPFTLKRRLPGPRRTRLAAVLDVPRGGYLFELRVSAWLHTRPPEPRDRYLAPWSEDELRLARRLALQLRVPWVEPPAGLVRQLATQVRWLRGAQGGGRRGVTIWLRQAEELPRADRRWHRHLLTRRRLLDLQLAAARRRRREDGEA
jgi:hypothetical protein